MKQLSTFKSVSSLNFSCCFIKSCEQNSDKNSLHLPLMVQFNLLFSVDFSQLTGSHHGGTLVVIIIFIYDALIIIFKIESEI